MTFYLTFNDAPSGIYSSQVIDVVNFLNNELHSKTKLVAFISLRGFTANRKKIKNELKDAIVLPMWPKLDNWKKNRFLLSHYVKKLGATKIIGRSVLATQLALNTGKEIKDLKVIYDGRGAIAAEWEEYKVVTNEGLLKEIKTLEKEAVLNSVYRIAVSEQLVKNWQLAYGYKEVNHAVIPCTLNKIFETIKISNESIKRSKQLLNLNDNDIVFAFSGSVAGWQSFELLYNFVKPVLQNTLNAKLLFLSDQDPNILALQKEFPERVICRKVSPTEVPDYLIAADYGLLIREESVTNKVASPVKFAEYLACGLKVIISDNLGDYSNLVKANAFGYLYKEFNSINKTSDEEKQEIRRFAIEHFTKENYKNKYREIVAL